MRLEGANNQLVQYKVMIMKNKANWKPDTMCNSGGKYKVRVNGRHTPAYGAWSGVMQRCYNKGHKSFEWYGGNGVTVDLVWHDYQCFAEWYSENYPLVIENGRLVNKLDDTSQRWQLDKDIRVPGNKVYGALTCCFMTRRLNNLFTDSGAIRGDLPLGVSNHGNGYKARCNDGTGKSITKTFHCLPDAVDHYWKLKFRFTLAACEEISDYDESLGELVMDYFHYFKEKHYLDL